MKRKMNETDAGKDSDVICHCSGTTEAKIRELIDKGIDNLDRISRITGACSGCGSCDSTVLELLDKHAATGKADAAGDNS